MIRALVESAIRAIFRLCRKDSESLFQTLISSHRQFLHFRFVAASFVHSLSAYVFDTAIGANFDALLSRVSSAQDKSPNYEEDGVFSDIYTLAAYHSTVLDDILSACLLRSGQRAAGDLLRTALELILDFGILAGQLHRGLVEEYKAATQVEYLFRSFRGKMQTLVCSFFLS